MAENQRKIEEQQKKMVSRFHGKKIKIRETEMKIANLKID